MGMNILAEELAKWFEEVPAMEFYREVFPELILSPPGLLKFFFRLAGETYNHIRRNRRMLEHLTQQAAFLRVFRRGILPIHAR